MFTLPTDRLTAPAWGADMYRSPHASYAIGDTPQGWRNILLWCQNIFSNNGTIRNALDRVVSYFLTDIDIGAASSQDYLGTDEKEKWENQFDSMDVIGFTRRANMDNKCYGSYFASLVVPFKRFLVCKRCHSVFPFKEVADNPRFAFNFSGFEFHAKCPRSECKYSGVFEIMDEPKTQQDEIKLKLWPPTEIEIVHDMFTNDTDYVWRIPEDYKNQLRSARTFHLERASQPLLQAVKNNQLYRFNRNMIFQGSEVGPTGIRTRGWGMSPLLYSSRMVWYVELLHRYNEAMALDYVMPLRVITPAEVPKGGGDPYFGGTNLGDFSRQINAVIRTHRRNPTSWHTLPFPVNFQQFGGDATKLVPYELLNQGFDTLLNALGAPVEMFRGSMQLQVAPTAMRMFESQHRHMVHQNNSFLGWLIERLCEVLNWEPVHARYRRVQHADDMQRQLNILQMAMGGRVSETEALRTLGLDWRDQRRQTMEEARYDQELQSRMQEEMDQTAYGQQIAKGMPQGGAPGQPGQPGQAGAPVNAPPGGPMQPGMSISSLIPGPGNPMTPEDMEAAADTAAQQLLGMPSTQRISELRALADKNPAMHKIVRGKLDEKRSQARSQGGSVLLQQQYGGS